MSRLDRRVEKVLEGLGPEEKARLFIEGPLLGQAVSKAEEWRLLAKLTPEEGWRYNAYLARWETLQHNLRVLFQLAGEVKAKLLERDRLRWYWRGVQDLEEALVFQHGKVLLEQNPHVKPHKPLELRTLLGVVRLGVSGKDRLPFGKHLGSELRPGIEEVLDLHAQGIRQRAGECKALGRYLEEEAQVMGLATVGPLVTSVLEELREYDRPLLREVREGAQSKPPPGALLPVDERWALVWEEVPEDAETARRVRADPEGWEPPSVDRVRAGRSWGEVWQELMEECAAGRCPKGMLSR